MKIFVLMVMSLLGCYQTEAQDSDIPADFIRDSLPALVSRTKDLLDHSYMAKSLITVTDTLPGWEGYPVKLYQYETGNDLYTGKPKVARVYLLDPSPEKLAMWIVTACWEVKKSLDYKYVNELFTWIRGQSGAQFPVKGLVYEDQYTRDFQEPYVFKDGVTVYIRDSTYFPKDKTCTQDQINYYLHLSNDQLKPQTGKYGRIASTTREDYLRNGGTEEVGNADDRKIKWLDVVRDLYKKAWNADRNELIVDWARVHLQ